ncbi:uncharacterized protein LOC127806618 isoform X2 [Diospyros lotus]|uniref:uncharacterized protein LOC127806618 isoform X2 n=1 Tax=Diospyros lotus TaxID=55363 RepID=UPI0022556F00|nr:uncharacterized protein LOC127806618 isoform X2 [Diospyros lotus]
MAASDRTESKWLAFSLTLAVATISSAVAVSVYFCRRNSRFDGKEKVRELEKALKSSLEKCASERQGRIRAQQALRETLVKNNSENLQLNSYPMAPIGVVRSCYSTRNGTPRQPLLVPLARAQLLFYPTHVPPASLEGLEEYSHCWIIYVFHLNTDLEKLWKDPSNSKFKAKVRVPRLKGRRMGVFATRSPHRPCPIGLTVAKVEAIQEHMVLVSGADLVDGTADNLLTVTSVDFSEDFTTALADCWTKLGKKSLYASPDEFQSLIKQVLSWDIRSISQRSRPHNSLVNTENGTKIGANSLDLGNDGDEGAANSGNEEASSGDIIYHLVLEGIDVSYSIDSDGNVLVKNAKLQPLPSSSGNSANS